jgi:hypothetical protein
MQTRSLKRKATLPPTEVDDDALLLIGLNDDVLREIMHFLPSPSAVAFASTSRTCRAILDDTTINSLVATEVPIFAKVLERHPTACGTSFYKEFNQGGRFARKRALLELEDVAFAVRFGRAPHQGDLVASTVLYGEWHSCEAGIFDDYEIALVLPRPVLDQWLALKCRCGGADCCESHHSSLHTATQFLQIMAVEIATGRSVQIYGGSKDVFESEETLLWFRFEGLGIAASLYYDECRHFIAPDVRFQEPAAATDGEEPGLLYLRIQQATEGANDDDDDDGGTASTGQILSLIEGMLRGECECIV